MPARRPQVRRYSFDRPSSLDAGVLQERLPDLLGRGLGQGEQECPGVPAPAGEVHGAHQPARDRVMDGDTGAGQVLEVFGVVLVAEYVSRTAHFQGGADAVGADELLGIAEPRREKNLVEVRFEGPVAGHPAEHEPGGVREDDAHRLALELFAECAQHRSRTAGEAGVQLDVGLEGHLDLVRRDVQLPRPPPRGEDGVPDGLRRRRLLGEEAFATLGDQALGGRLRLRRHTSGVSRQWARRHPNPPRCLRPTTWRRSLVRVSRTRPEGTVSY